MKVSKPHKDILSYAMETAIHEEVNHWKWSWHGSTMGWGYELLAQMYLIQESKPEEAFTFRG